MTEELESYESILEKLKKSTITAKTLIPLLCNTLETHDPTLNKKEIGRRVRKDCIALGLAKDYVSSCIPEGYKDEDKSIAGKKGVEKKKEIEIMQGNKNSSSTSDDDNRAEISKQNSSMNEDTNTLEIQKASELIDQPQNPTIKKEHENIEKIFKLESDRDKYKKESFDRLQEIEELKTQVERLTNQVNTQAEHIKENLTTTPTQDTPKIFPFTLQTKTLLHECPKCHLQQDLPVTGRVYHQNSWVVYIDNIEAQKQQAQKWRNVLN